jgi:hypothetical protein
MISDTRADHAALVVFVSMMRCWPGAHRTAAAARNLIEFFVLQFLFVRRRSVFQSRLPLFFHFRSSSAGVPQISQSVVAQKRLQELRAAGPVETPPDNCCLEHVSDLAVDAGNRAKPVSKRGRVVLTCSGLDCLNLRFVKGSTARSANLIPARTGKLFWQDESWNHSLRTATTAAYIERNPVSAGLVRSQERRPWFSTGWQAEPTAPPRPRAAFEI